MSEDVLTDEGYVIGPAEGEEYADDYEPPEPHGYTIAGKAGPEFADQVKLADWHLRKAAEQEAVTAAILAPFAEELERLESETARLVAEMNAVTKQRERDPEWHKAQVQWWFLDCNVRETTGKASLSLPYGIVKSRQNKGKTEVDEETILGLWRQDPEAYADCIKQAVSASAVRKRFSLLESGEVEDQETGEIMAEDIIRQIEPPSVSVTVELTGKPKAEE